MLTWLHVVISLNLYKSCIPWDILFEENTAFRYMFGKIGVGAEIDWLQEVVINIDLAVTAQNAR